jgi:hypothetical protein
MRSIVALALVAVSIGAAVPVMAQGVPAAEMPTAEEAPAAPPASAIPKPAAESKPAKKTAKKKVSCDGLFEAACKETEGCSWSGGLAKADGSPPKGDCAKVDKTASKGSKTSCPTMFEALCKETSGKASKAAPAKKAAAAAPSPAPDAFTDQQEK